MDGTMLHSRNVTPQAPSKIKFKCPALSDYDLSTGEKIIETLKKVKGEETHLLQSLMDMLIAIFNEYKVDELKSFTKEKLHCDWPKGNKSTGVHYITSKILKEIGRLLEFKHSIDDNKQAVDPTEKLKPTDMIYVS